MNTRQSTLVQSMAANPNNDAKGGIQTRARGAPKKYTEVATPITELAKGKETRKKKLNNSKLDDYFDAHGNDKTIISSDPDNGYNDKEFYQSSISSVSTNTTMDYERINNLKSIKLASEFNTIPSGNSITIGGNSNFMQVEEKPVTVNLAASKKPALDFKEFLDEEQKLKLKKQEELKVQQAENESKRKKLLSNFQNMKSKSSLSSSTSDIISKILNKGTNTNKLSENSNAIDFDKVSSTQKIDMIQERLLSNLKVKSPTKKETKSENQSNGNKMIDEREEIGEVQTQLVDNSHKTKEAESKNEEEQSSINTANENNFDKLIKSTLNNERALEIMAGPSIKQRYEDLLSVDRKEFILPYKYKLILASFEKFDECIAFFKERNKPTLFNELKFNMEQAMRATISLKVLQQIMFLYPQSYQLKWVKNENAHERWDLVVNFASDENESREVITKSDRLAKFRNLLVDRVKYLHRLYLKSAGRDHMEQELLDHYKWHDDFKLQDVINIEEAPLPLKPFEIKVEALQDIVQKNQVKNEILAKLMQSKAEEQAEKERKRKELIEKSLYISTQNNNTGLSDRLYQLIKAKEEKLNEEKMRQSLSKNDEMRGRITEIKKVVEIVTVYFIQRKVSNMFYVSVVDYLASSFSAIISKIAATEILDHLIHICPYWITLIPNKQGNIIRIDRTVPISRILAEVEKAEN